MKWMPIDSEALRQYFNRKYGPTYPTIMAGIHLGAVITYGVIERFPESFDGALAVAGVPVSSYEFCKESMFDMRLVFDYFLPGMPGSVVDYPADTGFNDYRNKAIELVEAHPEQAAMLARRFNLQGAKELAVAVSLYTSILGDLYVNRCGGSAFDNTNTVYWGFPDDGKINREIKRYQSDPQAITYMRQWNTNLGRISDPVLAVNSLYDAVIPIQYCQQYAQACGRQGTSHLFVQKWMDSATSFPRSEGMQELVNDLDAWIRTGKRPEPGELKAGFPGRHRDSQTQRGGGRR